MLERVVSLLYVFTVCLMLTVLWAMAETRSLESRTIHFLPAEQLQTGATQVDMQ